MVAGRIVISFFMPLFFFISGFFAYKPCDMWTCSMYRKQIPQKVKALVICTVVFYTFRYYIIGADPLGWLNKGFMGYWFTIVLFDMFVIYYTATFASNLLKSDISIPLMCVLALIGPALIHFGITDEGLFGTVLGTTNLCFYLQWFVLGLIVRKHDDRFNRILSNGTVKAILMICYIVLLCADYDALPPVVAKIISSMIVSYVGVLTITALFLSFRDFFNGHSRVAGYMCFVGRRTLDIYMLHYLFLPSLPLIGVYLVPDSMVLFQLIYGLGTAVIITSICLLLSSCLRTSPVLADWFFGVRASSNRSISQRQ